jgi:hypothetical protein
MADQARDDRDLSIEFAVDGRGSFSATGSSESVFRALAEFREEIGKIAAEPPAQATVTRGSDAIKPVGNVRVSDTAADLLPLGPFVKAKGPKTNPQAVAVVASWDKRKNGTAEFTIESLTKLWNAAGLKPAGNFPRDIQGAAKQGWLETLAKGKYGVTGYGDNFVDSLPEGPKPKG